MTPTITAMRLGRLGDLVMTLPALQWLAEDAVLQVVVGEPYVDLLKGAVPGARVVGDPEGLAVADVVLDLHGVPASRRLLPKVPASAAAIQLATRKESHLRRPLLVPGLRSLMRPRRTWPERHLEAARRARTALGLPSRRAPAVRPSLVELLPPDAGASGSNSVPAPVLGLVVGAGEVTKRWPLDHFVRLASLWTERTGGTCRLFAGPGEEGLVDRVAGAVPGVERWLEGADTPLRDLCHGLSGCDVVVAGDTGPLHLAGALGRPVVGLFGPTPRDAGFWVWGDRGTALRTGVGCSPCSMHGQRGCWRGRRACLEDLIPEDVLAAALGLTVGVAA